MISVRDLTFSYGKKSLLNGVSFEAHEGECVVLAGSNGSGKSTTLSLVTGTLKPESGEVHVEGRIGFVPQGTALFEDMTVEDNLRFFAGLFKASIPETLPFDLNRDRNKKVSRLSGGRKKQVSIACALLGAPENLLLDEPAAGLDLMYQQQLSDLLLRLKEEGRTILYVGHNPLEYASFFDRIVFLGGETPEYFERSSFSEEEGEPGRLADRIAENFKTRLEQPASKGEK